MYVNKYCYTHPYEEREFEVEFTPEDAGLYGLLQQGLRQEQVWEETEVPFSFKTSSDKATFERIYQHMLQYPGC